MKNFFVVFGLFGFLAMSGIFIAGLNNLSTDCYLDIMSCNINLGLILFVGALGILSLASFVGGLANSEIE